MAAAATMAIVSGLLTVTPTPASAATVDTTAWYVLVNRNSGKALDVYNFSTDDGANWDRMGLGLPVVPARDLYVARNQDFIRVATYGRGLWEIYPSATASQGSPGNGDYDRNLQIDWVDLGAMSTRLGTTPATAVAPLYSWIEDVTGVGSSTPLQAIDDADLTALLAKFGDHP
jgi:hypothetical protein